MTKFDGFPNTVILQFCNIVYGVEMFVENALKKAIGKSISTVKRLTVSLQKKGILVRKNGKRDGYYSITLFFLRNSDGVVPRVRLR